MQVIPLTIIHQADTRIPNNLPTAQKLQWLNELEGRIRWDIRPIYDEYTFTVDGDKPYVLPCSEEQIEWVYRNGKNLPKIDLRSAEGLQAGNYRILYRALPHDLSDTVITDENAVFSETGITFSKPHPFAVGDFIGISDTAANNVTATVVAVDNTTVTTDCDGFTAGEQSATVSKINDRELEIPQRHACFGIYEEYLCMQLAKHLCDAERYRLASAAFEQLWNQLALSYKQTAPQNITARVRGI